MANAQRNADLSLAIFRLLWTGCRFTAIISNLFLVLHKCNVWIYFLLLLTQVDFFGTTFYFLESRKFLYYFYFLKSRFFGMYFYFLESSKVIYFWQHWLSLPGVILLLNTTSILVMVFCCHPFCVHAPATVDLLSSMLLQVFSCLSTSYRVEAENSLLQQVSK